MNIKLLLTNLIIIDKEVTRLVADNFGYSPKTEYFSNLIDLRDSVEEKLKQEDLEKYHEYMDKTYNN